MTLLSFFTVLLSLSLFAPSVSEGRLNIRPRQLINYVSSGRRFEGRPLSTSVTSQDGTLESESDNFRLLQIDGTSLMVGARDAVYNLSMASLEVQHVLEWTSPGQTVEDCLMKGKTKTECRNYIRVLVRQSNGRCLVCGTHAFSPKCREYAYSHDDRSLQQRRQFDGQAISPYDPRDNSTAVYLPETDEIYTGTVSDFAGNDPLIYRKRLSDDEGLRTQRDDLKVLDAPNFVASFVYGEHVYFWFRERAADAVDVDRQVYARVARVCKDDRGGPRPAHDRWTSFVKARLNCSISADIPFYFNELQSVTNPVLSDDGSMVVYAVFTTQESSVRMSTVCSYKMDDIKRVFDNGLFKVQKTSQSLWTPYRPLEMVPVPRPGSCVSDSSKLSESTMMFIVRNPLIYEAIPSISGPLFIQGPDQPELTQITVSSQIRSVSGAKHNALYIGTSDGRVLKVIDPGKGETSIVQSARIFAAKVPIVNLLATSDQLIVVSSNAIAAVPVFACSEQTTCSGCVRLQDAHCAWDLNSARCVGSTNGAWSVGSFVQNVNIGQSEQCPEGAIDPDYTVVDDVHFTDRVTSAEDKRGHFTAQGLLLAVLVAIAVSSAGGFLVGYRISRWRIFQDSHHHSSGSFSGSDFDSYGRTRLTRHDSLPTTKVDHVYGTSPTKDAVSLILTMPQNGATVINSISNCGSGAVTPRTDKNLLNNTTLPRDYKVKKVYL